MGMSMSTPFFLLLDSLEKLREHLPEILQMPDLVLRRLLLGNGSVILYQMGRSPTQLLCLEAIVVAVVC